MHPVAHSLPLCPGRHAPHYCQYRRFPRPGRQFARPELVGSDRHLLLRALTEQKRPGMVGVVVGEMLLLGEPCAHLWTHPLRFRARPARRDLAPAPATNSTP